MAAKIRLSRQGARNDPNFAVVVMDSSKKRDGAFLQRVGQYFPKEKDPQKKLILDREAYMAWIKKGAEVSRTVAQLATASLNKKG